MSYRSYLLGFLNLMLLWIGLCLITLSVVAFLSLASSYYSEPPPDEGELIEAMKDLRESMDKLNEELRDFEFDKEETVGKDSESDTDIQE